MKRWIHRVGVIVLVAVQLSVCPTVSFAETTTPSNTPGPNQPTGADRQTYHYNEQTGLWENGYYTWNPATNQTSPKTTPSYSYNPQTQRWDTKEYLYDPTKNAYVPNAVSIDRPPTDVKSTTPVPSTVPASSPNNTTPKTDTSLSSTTNNTGTFDLFYNDKISNAVDSKAQSGNATVSSNTFAGNAQSGNATAIATIVNLLQSSLTGIDPNNLRIFSADLTGNRIGDLYIDPAQLAPQSNASSNSTQNSKVSVNASDSAALTNKVDLSAASGNATVSGNTEAGDATSGDATALANIINMLSSSINAGHLFLGNLNIYGSLNGDILLPTGMEDQLLASNSGPATNTDVSAQKNTDSTVHSTTNTGISNNLDVSAASGSAAVNNNTSAGSAITGKAATNVNLLNLAGQDIIGGNALLVLINNLGQWEGGIVHAPQGATAAELGGNISRSSLLSTALDSTTTTNQQIKNNISAHATTGNTAVNGNTQGGNATSGAATVGVNLLNMANSSYSLANWFGVMFINVLGSWNGSFGIDTIAGSQPSPVVPPTAHEIPHAVLISQLHAVPATIQTAATTKQTNLPASNASSMGQSGSARGVVLHAASTTRQISSNTPEESGQHLSGTVMASAVSVIAGLLLVLLDRARMLQRSKTI